MPSSALLMNPHPLEVMSPAGHWPQLQAAVEAGADAVYFGLNHFTARAKVGFSLAELPQVMRALHQRGVRGYLTFNTLVFDHELAEAARAIAAIAEDGVVVTPAPALRKTPRGPARGGCPHQDPFRHCRRCGGV